MQLPWSYRRLQPRLLTTAWTPSWEAYLKALLLFIQPAVSWQDCGMRDRVIAAAISSGLLFNGHDNFLGDMM